MKNVFSQYKALRKEIERLDRRIQKLPKGEVTDYGIDYSTGQGRAIVLRGLAPDFRTNSIDKGVYTMGEALGKLRRTIMCGELRREHIGQTVTLMGWVQTSRDKGSLIFCDLRDRADICQVVFREETAGEAHTKAKGLRREYCVAITGVVAQREAVNPNLPTGEIELNATALTILSEAKTPAQFADEIVEKMKNKTVKIESKASAVKELRKNPDKYKTAVRGK